MAAFIGIDTSNYKTSAAAVSSDGSVIWQRSEFLAVEKGQRGLRQSEAFFRHSCALPDFMEELTAAIDISEVSAIGVSSRPRRVDGSYMPCFLAGVNAAREIASVLDVPLHQFSHQEGHAAAILECPEDPAPSGDFAFFHLSGGTTEFLLCRMDDMGYSMDKAGGTLDISIGQLLDRAGVRMGLPFPSGRYLDEMALGCLETPSCELKRVTVKDDQFNLSGTEAQIMRLLDASDEVAGAQDMSRLVSEIFQVIADILVSAAGHMAEKHDVNSIYMAGGVASSASLRRLIGDTITLRNGRTARVIFGDPILSGDNAVGTARLARRMSLK